MAELVDALVSNTSDSNIVPVRPRLWVLHKGLTATLSGLFLFYGKILQQQKKCEDKYPFQHSFIIRSKS